MEPENVYAGKEQLIDIAREHGTPITVIDHDVIRDNYNHFKAAMPRVEPFYAVKANPESEIIKTLQLLGAGFDIASWEEFMMVYETLSRTVDKKQFMETQTIYANPVKRIDSLRTLHAFDLSMTYDNFNEVDKIAKYCQDANLILRIDVPNEGSVVELSSKFGAEPKICLDLLKYAKSKNLDLKGLSFHVGSQCPTPNNYVKAFEIARSIFDQAEGIGIDLEILDIGGGFPAPYDESVISFDEFAKTINNQIKTHFDHSRYRLIAEPGRFLVATSAVSLLEINGIGMRKGKKFYYVNDGVYGTFSGVIFDHINYHFKCFKTGQLSECAIVGPTCDALDKLSMSEQLPDLCLGDIIYAENTGAYTTASATTFNGFALPKILHINKHRGTNYD